MTTRYRSTAQELLDKARQALAQGNLLQASEKGWGAVAQITKAVAESRGWPHNSHGLLYQAVTSIVNETETAASASPGVLPVAYIRTSMCSGATRRM